MKAAWNHLVLAAITLIASPAVANDDAGWYGRVDALLLAANVSSPGFGNIFQGVPDNVEFGGNLDGGLQGAWRVVAGKENCTGLGVRFQYFQFDNAVSYNGEWEGASDFLFNGKIDVNVYAADIEATQRATFCFWDLQVSGGLRAGGVDIEQNGDLYAAVASFYGIPSGVDFDGVGPTLAIQGERALGGSNLYLVGRGRVSLLFGETAVTPTFGAVAPPIPTATAFDFVQVTEIQFGLNYRKCLGAADGTFGVFWEAQRWDSDSNALGDLSLHGLSLQTGLLY